MENKMFETTNQIFIGFVLMGKASTSGKFLVQLNCLTIDD